jgi:hypothetical protein
VYILPLVLLRLSLILSVLFGFSETSTYSSSFELLIKALQKILSSYFSKIDKTIRDHKELESLEISRQSFVPIFAENIDAFITALSIQIRNSIENFFSKFALLEIDTLSSTNPLVDDNDLYPPIRYKSFTDILFHVLVDKKIFNFVDFKILLPRKDSLVGVFLFRSLYLKYIRREVGSDDDLD